MKTLFVITLCLLSFGLFAQKTEGLIEYKETIKFELELEGMDDLPEEMKAMIPNEQTIESKLYFNKSASLYTNANDSKEEEHGVDYKSDDEDIQIKIQMDAPEYTYYKDLKTKEVVANQDLFGKLFLITGQTKMKWKLSSDSKEILGYSCKKATTTDKEGKKVEAWFTSEIPVSIGPSKYNQLPGAVLEVIMDEGKRVVVANKVEFKSVDAKKMAKPKKGKKVTNEEYHKIVEEKQKEMAEIYGGKGNVIIKTEEIER